MKGYRLWIIGLATLLLVGCKQESKRQYWNAEMAPQQVEIVRFDQAVMNIDTAKISEAIGTLFKNYPEVMPVWADYLYVGNMYSSAGLEESLPQMLNDTVFGFKYLIDKEKAVFANTDDIQQSLNKAFTRIKYLYPETQIPVVYLNVLGSFFANDEWVTLSADGYLGSDFPYYDNFVYEYQKQTMRKECIPVDIIVDFLSRNTPYSNSQTRLLDQMIYRGKIMYLTAQIFDELPGYEVMGWTKDQWGWSVQNEGAVWDFMMDQRHLFSTNNLMITNYLNDAPFTSEVSQDSPGRLGIWVGWRIVEQYMEKNPNVTLQDLMAENDAQKILTESKYRP